MLNLGGAFAAIHAVSRRKFSGSYKNSMIDLDSGLCASA
jgi:hypothetical protein